MKIIHTADIHLRDSQFGRTDRGQDFTDALLNLVEVASKNGVHHIIASGDILNVKRPSSKTINDILIIDEKLKHHDVELITIPGDHDYCTPSWISALTGLRLSNISDVTDKVVKVGDLTIYGAPAPCMHPDRFRAMDWPQADILLYHGPLREFAAYPTGEKDLAIADLPTSKYRFIALGDLHATKYKRKDGCLFGYPGPTEYCSAHESETKTATLVDMDTLEFELLRIKTRKVIKRIIAQESDLEELLDELRKCKKENPIVKIWIKSPIKNVIERISAVVDPKKAIINVTVNSDKTDDSTDVKIQNADARVEDPSYFLADFVSDTASVYPLLVSLCVPENSPAALIEEYINKKQNGNK